MRFEVSIANFRISPGPSLVISEKCQFMMIPDSLSTLKKSLQVIKLLNEGATYLLPFDSGCATLKGVLQAIEHQSVTIVTYLQMIKGHLTSIYWLKNQSIDVHLFYTISRYI